MSNHTIIKELIAINPIFIEWVRKECDLWLDDNGDIKLCPIFSILTDFVINDLKNDHKVNYYQLFQRIEMYMNSDSQELKDAAATCFIENPQNISNEIDPILWVLYLGKKSKEFALGWDVFTGVKTNGLY